MTNTAILLFFEFFKVGLFTFGGGYASLPFLYQISEVHKWFSTDQLTQLIAISGLTPGPIGLNMATFSGFITLKLFGAIVASFALILPMIVITSQVFRLYRRFSENECVKSVLYFLKPTSCALICAVAIKLFYEIVLGNTLSFSNFDLSAFILLIILFILTFFLKRNPLNYILIAGIFGLIAAVLK